MHLQFRKRVGFEPLNQHQIHRIEPRQQIRKLRLLAVHLVQQRPTSAGGHQHLVCSRDAMPEAVLTWPVHVEAVMRVLYRGHSQAARPEYRQQRREQSGFAAAGPADDAEHFHRQFRMADVRRAAGPHHAEQWWRGGGRRSDSPIRLPGSVPRQPTASSRRSY